LTDDINARTSEQEGNNFSEVTKTTHAIHSASPMDNQIKRKS